MLKKIIFTLQPKIESSRFSVFKKIFKQQDTMKQLHNISSLQHWAKPMGQGYTCMNLLDNEFVIKRCLYIWVS